MENNDVIFSNDEVEQLIIFGSFDYKAYREKGLDQIENYHPFSFPEEKEEDGDVEIPQVMDNFDEVSQINNDCNVVAENEVLTSNSAMNDHQVPSPKHVLESSRELEEGSCEVQKHSTNFQIPNQCYENDSFCHTSERNDSPKRSEEGHCVEVVSKPEEMQQIEQMKEEFDVVLKENNVQKTSSENEVLDLILNDHVDQVVTQLSLSISASLLEKETSCEVEDIEARPEIEKVESNEVTENETKKITEIESIFDYTKGLSDYEALCFSDEKAKAEAEKRKRRNLKKKEKKAKNKIKVEEEERWQPYFCSQSRVLIVFMGVVSMMVLVFKCKQLMVDFSALEAEV